MGVGGSQSVRELDILLVENLAPALDGLTQLVQAMHHLAAAPAIRARQVNELRRVNAHDQSTPRLSA
jgi:hypothetical protein